MAQKDKVYDPDIRLDDYDEESDCDLAVNECNYNQESEDDLNNINYKVFHSCTSDAAVSVIYTHNHTSGSLYSYDRMGGPQMDHPVSSGASADKPTPINVPVCCNCGDVTMEWLEGSRFECHRRYTRQEDQEQLDAHNQLCRACATDEDRCDMCPIHPNSYYNEYVDTNTVPRVVRRFDNSSGTKN